MIHMNTKIIDIQQLSRSLEWSEFLYKTRRDTQGIQSSNVESKWKQLQCTPSSYSENDSHAETVISELFSKWE